MGLARRHMRRARWYLLLIPLHFALVSLWIYATCYLASSVAAWCSFYTILGVAWLLGIPLRVVPKYRNFQRAERANEEEADPPIGAR
jgi:DMSO reductase anchor subunit